MSSFGEIAIFAARFLVNSHNASSSKSLDKNRGECEPLSLCLWRLGNDMDVKVAKARGESEDTPQKLQKPLSPACIQRTSPFQMQIWRYLARSSTGVMLARCGRREWDCVTGSPTRSSSWKKMRTRRGSLKPWVGRIRIMSAPLPFHVVFAADPDAIHLGKIPPNWKVAQLSKGHNGPAVQSYMGPVKSVMPVVDHFILSATAYDLDTSTLWRAENPSQESQESQADDLPDRYDVTIVVAVGYGATAS